MKTQFVGQFQHEYEEVVQALNPVCLWTEDWARRQYVGLVLTAMCHTVVENAKQAKQYAVLRAMETFVEHRYNLFPAQADDWTLPRQRVDKLQIPGAETECAPWIDVLEYIQLLNWRRKGLVAQDAFQGRIDELGGGISREFSPELLDEIKDETEQWWAE